MWMMWLIQFLITRDSNWEILHEDGGVTLIIQKSLFTPKGDLEED